MKIKNIIIVVVSMALSIYIFFNNLLDPIVFLVGPRPTVVSIKDIKNGKIDEFSLVTIIGSFHYRYTLELQKGLFTEYLYPLMSVDLKHMVYIVSYDFIDIFKRKNSKKKEFIGVVKKFDSDVPMKVARVDLPKFKDHLNSIAYNTKLPNMDPNFRRSISPYYISLYNEMSPIEHIGKIRLLSEIIIFLIPISIACYFIFKIINDKRKN